MTDSFDPREPTERELLEAIFRASLSEEEQQLPLDLLLDIAMDENAEESDSFSAVPPSPQGGAGDDRRGVSQNDARRRRLILAAPK